MSKELKAFRKICRCLSSSYEFTDEYKKNKKRIETTLKDYDKLFKMFPYEETSVRGILIVLTQLGIKDSDTLLKKLKALDIVKKKNVDVGAVKNCINAYAYNGFKELTETKLIKRENITQEEFDLLKEVML